MGDQLREHGDVLHLVAQVADHVLASQSHLHEGPHRLST